MHTPAVCFWPTRIRAGIYVPRMRDGGLTRSYGTVFNEIAAEYDRNRLPIPTRSLITHAGWRASASATACLRSAAAPVS